MDERDFDLLTRLPLFGELGVSCLRQVTAEAQTLRPKRGEVIFHQGQSPRFLHIVLEGQVGLVGAVSDGEETVVEILKPGEVFIAAAVLTDRPYLMAAHALQNSRILALPGEKLRRDIRGNPDLAMSMVTSLASHYRMLVREIKDLKLKSAAQRLALYLIGQLPRRDGPAIVRLAHSKGVIAARIGIRSETLSRAFTVLRAEGVEIRGTLVTIADPHRLAAFCHEGEEQI